MGQTAPNRAAGDFETAALSLIFQPGYDTRAARLFAALVRGGPLRDPLDQLLDVTGVDPAERAGRVQAARERARRALSEAAGCGATLIGLLGSGYPPRLREIPDPPIALWLRGQPEALAQPAVAVVGSRDASAAGLAAARRLGRDLARAGLVVVSGLARGVDAAAHEGALEADGVTVAVLGCGPERIYPPEHEDLAARLRRRGALVTEFPPGTAPLPAHFPLRNRIISGLSLAVVVVEASERSGSLITARAALEQGRDVLAVPGGIASGRHRGCHALIKDGARLVETVDDILEEVGWGAPPGQDLTDSSKVLSDSYLQAVMAPGDPRSLDDLVSVTGRPVQEVLADLAVLEMAGLVGRVQAGHFVWLDGPAMDR